MICPLCHSVLDQRIDPYFFECLGCGAYVKDQKFYLDSEKEKSRYNKHNNNVNDLGYQKFTSPICNFILENYSPSHLGLDFGCGPGPVISKALGEKGYLVKLYDPFFYVDNDYLNHYYDYIFSCEVFEHLHYPKKEIEKLLKLLKPRGRLILMTHLYTPKIQFKNWYYRNDPTHVFIYVPKTMEYIANRFGLKLEILEDRLTVFRFEK